MSGNCHLGVIRRSLVGALSLTLAIPFLARAAEVDGAATGPTPVFSDPTQLLNSFALLLVFGLAIALAVLVFVHVTHSAYLRVAQALGLRGVSTSPKLVSATASTQVEGALDGPAAQLAVSGPERLTVGKPGTFLARLGDQPAESATWTVWPADAATVQPTAGASASVVAATSGQLVITATVDTASVALHLVVEDAVSGGTVLPFIGGGWGGIFVGVVVVTLIAMLGIAGVLGSEGVAGLIGTLIGYLFGIRNAGGTAGGSGATTAPGSSQTPPT